MRSNSITVERWDAVTRSFLMLTFLMESLVLVPEQRDVCVLQAGCVGSGGGMWVSSCACYQVWWHSAWVKEVV